MRWALPDRRFGSVRTHPERAGRLKTAGVAGRSRASISLRYIQASTPTSPIGCFPFSQQIIQKLERGVAAPGGEHVRQLPHRIFARGNDQFLHVSRR